MPNPFTDDTSNRILDQKGEERPNRNGEGICWRTGTYTSGDHRQILGTKSIIQDQFGACGEFR